MKKINKKIFNIKFLKVILSVFLIVSFIGCQKNRIKILSKWDNNNIKKAKIILSGCNNGEIDYYENGKKRHLYLKKGYIIVKGGIGIINQK